MTITVLLADDEPLVRGGLRAILESEQDLQVVAEANDGDGAIRLARQHQPDVILMDVRMPRIDGITATRLLTESNDQLKIVVVTTFENDAYVFDALAAGAHGFLLKREAPHHVIHAVRTVHRGDSLLFPDSVRRLAAARSTGKPGGTDLIGRLTEREQQILRLMARGLSNTEIAAELVLGVETIKTHVRHILAKLGVKDRLQAVITAYEAGFILAGGRDIP